jgi:hypothetical protein
MAAINEMEYEYEAPPRRSWGKRWVLIAVVILVIAGSIALVRWRVAFSRAGTELEALTAKLDKTDSHWRIEDIERIRKEIPDGENTALVILQIETGMRGAAQAQMPATQKWPLESALESPPDVQIEPDIQARLRADLKRIAPQVKFALGLAEMRDGRFPLTIAPDGVSTLINSQAARQTANLLQQEMVLRLRDGDIEGACVAARAMLVAARSVGDEPFTVSQLIRIACASVAARSLERVLGQGEPIEATLATLQKMLEEEETTPYLTIAFRGERGTEHLLMDAIEDGKVSQIQSILGVNGTQNLNPFEKFWAPLQSRSAARFSHPELLRRMTDYLEIAKLPTPERDEQMRAKEQELKIGNPPVFVRLLLPGVVKVTEADSRVKASLRIAIAAVAAERFRLAKNRWPRDLVELTPSYLKAVPLDPYDGNSLRLRATEDGLLIYALGKDRKDNGGKVDRNGPNALGANIVFQLWNVPERRKPALNPDVGPPQPTEEDLNNMMMQNWMQPMGAPKAP